MVEYNALKQNDLLTLTYRIPTTGESFSSVAIVIGIFQSRYNQKPTGINDSYFVPVIYKQGKDESSGMVTPVPRKWFEDFETKSYEGDTPHIKAEFLDNAKKILTKSHGIQTSLMNFNQSEILSEIEKLLKA